MKKKEILSNLGQLRDKASALIREIESDYYRSNKEIFERNISRVAKAFCGSWFGYHSSIYYIGFETPIPADHFSPEWGFFMGHNVRESGWREMTYEKVKGEIMKDIDENYEGNLEKIKENAQKAFDEIKSQITTILRGLMISKTKESVNEYKEDLTKLKGKIIANDIVKSLTPSGVWSRDPVATSQGLKCPPHISIDAWHLSCYSVFQGLKNTVKIIDSLSEYLELLECEINDKEIIAKKVFIGHGGSNQWKELKEFLSERLKLECCDFNSESPAGKATKERLIQILGEAHFAFLIMTAEDEHSDKTKHARENVIHEIGLLQGRLGFERAIVLLENGCSEFSNIHGLNEIRFERDKLNVKFEEIRMVLERENIIQQT